MSAGYKPLPPDARPPEALVPAAMPRRHGVAQAAFGTVAVLGLGEIGYESYNAYAESSLSVRTAVALGVGALCVVASVFGFFYARENRQEVVSPLLEVRVDDLTGVSRVVEGVLREDQIVVAADENPKERLIKQILAIQAFYKNRLEENERKSQELSRALQEKSRQPLPLETEMEEVGSDVEMRKLQRELTRAKEDMEELISKNERLQQFLVESDQRFEEYDKQIIELQRLNEQMALLKDSNPKALAELSQEAGAIISVLRQSSLSRTNTSIRRSSISSTGSSPVLSPFKPTGGHNSLDDSLLE
jgi:hypothetical protein